MQPTRSRDLRLIHTLSQHLSESEDKQGSTFQGGLIFNSRCSHPSPLTICCPTTSRDRRPSLQMCRNRWITSFLGQVETVLRLNAHPNPPRLSGPQRSTRSWIFTQILHSISPCLPPWFCLQDSPCFIDTHAYSLDDLHLIFSFT